MQAMLLQQFLDLWQNAALVVLGVLSYAWVRGPLDGRPPALRAAIEGLFGAALAVLCMSAPLRVEGGVQIDARNAIVALVTAFGGPVAGAIAAVAAAAYRLWLSGAGAASGAVGVAATFGLSLPVWYGLGRTRASPGYSLVAALALAVCAALLIGLLVPPHDVAAAVWRQAGIAGFTIVPGSVFVLGAIMVRFERGRAAERRVAESEARLRSIIDHLPQPLSIRDREDRCLLVNKTYGRETGIAAAEAVGSSSRAIWERLQGSEPATELQRRVMRTGESGRTAPLAVVYRGRSFSLVFDSFPIRNPDGGFDAVGTIVTDVTELVAAQEKLLVREAMLQRQHQALIDVLRGHVMAERPLVETVRALNEITVEVVDASGAGVMLIDRERRAAQCVDAFLRSEGHAIIPELSLDAYPALWADLERERVVGIEDALTDPRVSARVELMRARGIRSLIAAGIYVGAQLEGVFLFVSVGAPRRWTAEDFAFARSVADLVALSSLTGRHREALATLDLVNEGIYVEREDGSLIYANRPARVLAGLSAADDGAPFPASVLPRPGVPLRGARDAVEIVWAVAGRARELSIRRSRLPGVGIVTVIEDVTAQKAEQRDHERLQAQMQQASKMEAIGQLASGVAHDFNNLLGAVIGFARFLEQDLPDGTQERRFAQRILSACNRGKELVAQILAFTRARAVDRKPIDLRAVVRDSRNLLAGSLPATTRLAINPGELPLVVVANETQLSQVMVNLCLNAHDAMAGRPGQITVELSRVRPGEADYRRMLLVGQLDPARAYARLDVADTGGGISAENLPRVFEPFFTTKERGHGTGLGLAVVHGVVTTYEGGCAVDSSPGSGTRFSVYFPLAEMRASRARDETPAADLRGSERVLIVDDEIDITDMLSIGLERLGYEVAALNDPAEALDAVREAPTAWDVIVTDQLMPGMQGLTLARELKSLRADLMVILCTGLDDGVVGQAAKAQGIDAFFVKPVGPEQVAAAIRGLASR
jgi:PAS domain S-box-containing protein